MAGSGIQIWTHGFVHHSDNFAREQVRGRVVVQDNVYIGSMSCISPGITIASNVAVGAHSSVANSLLQPGVYVSQKLRHIQKTSPERLAGMPNIADGDGSFRWKDGGGKYPGN